MRVRALSGIGLDLEACWRALVVLAVEVNRLDVLDDHVARADGFDAEHGPLVCITHQRVHVLLTEITVGARCEHPLIAEIFVGDGVLTVGGAQLCAPTHTHTHTDTGTATPNQ